MTVSSRHVSFYYGHWRKIYCTEVILLFTTCEITSNNWLDLWRIRSVTLKGVTTYAVTFFILYMFNSLIYFFEICFHFDLKEFIFVNSWPKIPILLAIFSFIKATVGRTSKGMIFFIGIGHAKIYHTCIGQLTEILSQNVQWNFRFQSIFLVLIKIFSAGSKFCTFKE